MEAPVLLLVAEDHAVLEALGADLGRRFGVDFQIIADSSPVAALTTLERLAARSHEVALVFADQGMTRVSGVEFLVGYYPILDRAPKGRDEGDTFQTWIRRHDEYA